MKKTVIVIIALLMVLSLFACGEYAGPKGKYVNTDTGSSISFNGKQATFEDQESVYNYDYEMDGETIVVKLTNGTLLKFYSYDEEEDTVYLNVEDGSRIAFIKND